MERQLRYLAAQKGQDIGTYLLSVATHQEATKEQAQTSDVRTQKEKNKAALEVLHAWREQNATNDPTELERRQADWEEFKIALDEDRPSERMLFP
jgi:hypothetical protein